MFIFSTFNPTQGIQPAKFYDISAKKSTWCSPALLQDFEFRQTFDGASIFLGFIRKLSQFVIIESSGFSSITFQSRTSAERVGVSDFVIFRKLLEGTVNMGYDCLLCIWDMYLCCIWNRKGHNVRECFRLINMANSWLKSLTADWLTSFR